MLLAAPSSPRPPVFNSFADMAWSFRPMKETVLDLNVAGAVSGTVRPNTVELEAATAGRKMAFYSVLEPSSWELFAPSSTFAFAATVDSEENPTPSPQCQAPATALFPSLQDFMAFQRCDPASFNSENLQYEDIPNREFMARAVAPVCPPTRNENLTIITIDSLPGNTLQFAAVRGVIKDFLHLEKRVTFLDI